MTNGPLAFSTLFLAACTGGPSSEQLARQCGTSVKELDRAKSSAKSLKPYQSLDVGKCSIIKTDSEVEVITPDTKNRVEIMLRQERQAALDKIADRCGAPRTAWKLLDADHVMLDGISYSSDKSTSTSCLITELGESQLPVKLGFIAEPPPEKQQ